MAEPDSTGILDEYGRRTGWIEIFNKSQGTVNYGGCFLSDDRNNLKKSPITKSDSRTKLGPRQVVLFHASGDGSDGTFYTGFEIRRGSTVYLVSNDGRTIVDSVNVPANLPPEDQWQKSPTTSGRWSSKFQPSLQTRHREW